MHPISILPSRCGTTARAQNWRTSARINGLKPTKLSVADDSDSVIPRVCPTPSCNTQAFPFEHLSLYYAKLNSRRDKSRTYLPLRHNKGTASRKGDCRSTDPGLSDISPMRPSLLDRKHDQLSRSGGWRQLGEELLQMPLAD